jgi:RimJ/RimL family protein N-acetyltransferase
MCVIERTPVIETRRLTLRAPERRDAGRLAELANDYDIVRMTSRMPWPYRRQDAEGFVDRCQMRDPRRDATFVIDLDDEGVTGCIGLFTPPGEPVEVGYWVGRSWWGRGLATEALKGALSWASREWGKRLVTAGHFADNPASAQVLIKAGFLYTGVVAPRPSLARGEPAATRMMVWLA